MKQYETIPCVVGWYWYRMVIFSTIFVPVSPIANEFDLFCFYLWHVCFLFGLELGDGNPIFFDGSVCKDVLFCATFCRGFWNKSNASANNAGANPEQTCVILWIVLGCCPSWCFPQAVVLHTVPSIWNHQMVPNHFLRSDGVDILR